MGDQGQATTEVEAETPDTGDDDIDYLLDVQATITAIEDGHREANDDTELNAHKKMFKERFRKAFLADAIENVTVVEEDDHGVKVTTERFEASGKRSRTESGDVRVTFATVEYPDEALTYKDVNGRVCDRITEAYRTHVSS